MIRKFTLYTLTLIGLFVTGSVVAQTYTMENGTVNACSGTFQDDNSGNAEGGPYSSEAYLFTICPDVPGNVVQVDFAAFDLANNGNPNSWDYLTIFDGPDTNSPSLGSYSGNSLQGLPITATINNPDGCLTFAFNPSQAGTDQGWEAFISCTTPCDPPVAASVIQDPAPEGFDQTVSVCLGQEITFADNGSTAGDGFVIDTYLWNWDDGTVDNTQGQVATHTFEEPGEYIVTLTVQDNNGCNSANIEPLQVLVSTLPEFNTELDTDICLGTTATLDGNPVQSVTWTALPPQVVSGESYLADGAGFSYNTPLPFNIFEPGSVLEDCDDLLAINVNMEHSYLGDLSMEITCPDGTTASIIEWPNGGGGCFLGEAVDDGSEIPGTGYDYSWSPNSTNGFIYDNANWTQVAYTDNAGNNENNNIANAGTYQTDGNLCDLVGCPLNGEWILTITDNIGLDNGYVFQWGIDFNPELFPDVTTFTPIIGLGSDSTFWEGPFLDEVSDDGNTMTVLPDAAGTYDYVFTAINNFGCEFDTTVQVTVTAMPEIQTVEDFSLCPGDVGQLGLGLAGEELPACFTEGGTFTYCYSDNDNTVWTYCPDNQGDGVTYMSIDFIAGTTENGFDEITFYDGPNTGSPVLDVIEGDLTGYFIQATNATGCITMQIDSDGSVSCQSGFATEWEYNVGCSSNLNGYDFAWTPEEGISDPAIYNPTVTIDQNTTFTVQAFPPGFPECATSDNITVSVSPDVDPGQDSTLTICFNFGDFNLIDFLAGTPVNGGEWTDEDGNVIDPNMNAAEDSDGVFTYTVSNDGCVAAASVNLTILPQGDPSCCEFEYTLETTGVTCFGYDDGTMSMSINFTTEGAPWTVDVYDAGNNLVESITSNDGNAFFQGLAPGDYSMDLTDVGLCATSEDFTIDDAIIQEFEVSMDTTICVSGVATLEAFSDEDPGDWFYTWDSGLPISGTVNVSPSVPTTYSVYATTSDGCELDPLEVQVTLHDSLNVSVIADTSICQATLATLGVDEFGGGFGDYTYTWSFLGEEIGIGDTIEYMGVLSGQYCVDITDECETPAVQACMQVDIEEPVDVQFVADVLADCTPLEVEITHLVDTAIVDEVFWDAGNGYTSEADTLVVTYENPGVYDVSLTITTNTTCVYSNSYPNYITAYANPIAGFYAEPQPTTIPDTEIQFYDYSEGSVILYNWVFDTLNYQGVSFEPNPIFEFPELEPGSYPVSLTVTDQNGCTDEAVRIVVINDLFNLFIPNSFTPNGDGVNDVFYVQGTDLDPDRFEMWIFDRWGGEVFHTKDINDVWTGNVNGGEYFIQDGVYNWRVVVHSLATAERKEFKGTVTVLR